MEEYVWISKVSQHPVFVAHAHPVLGRLAAQYGVKITIAGPEDTSGEAYVQALRSAIRRRVAGIMLVGWEDPNVVEAVNAAADEGVPIVTTDSDIPYSRRLGHAGTDWSRMGQAMAEELADLIGERGEVLMIGMTGLANMEAGFRGFRQRIAAYDDITVLGPLDDLDVRFARAKAIVAQHLAEHPDLAGVAGFDGNSGPGAALALTEAGREADVKLVCVDADEPQREHILTGAIDAAFCQKREAFTYLAFQMLYSYNHGGAAAAGRTGLMDIPGNIDTGFVLVTRENLDTFESELNLDDAFEHHKLSQRHALLSNMIENVGEIAMACDIGGRVVYANPATSRLCGFSGEQLKSLTIDDLFELSEEHRKLIKQCAGKGAFSSFETAVRKSDGGSIPVQLSVSPRQTDVNVGGIVLIAVDLTSRKAVERALAESKARLRQAQKMEAIGQLAGGLAHDFNNLLTAIMGNADLLRVTLTDNSESTESADQIIRAAQRAADLIKQMLAFARKGTTRVIPVDMHEIIGDVVELLARSIDPRIDVRQDLRSERAVIAGDPGQLQGALLNLAINARDAMPGGGELTFGTRDVILDKEGSRLLDFEAAPGDYIEVSVTDTGVGMDKETVSRIYEPFFTTKELGEGTGLGLSSVYGYVKNHNGCIRVQSEPGRGACFRILLPRTRARAAAAETLPAPEVVSGVGHILLVDDEEIIRNFAARALGRMGYDVTLRNDGASAVEFFRDHHEDIDLVILDMAMPRMDGRDAFSRLKDIDPNVGVLLATGMASEGLADDMLAAGVLGFLAKPFRSAQLSQAVAQAMRISTHAHQKT